MDEARRFLRYVMPGLAFVIQTTVILLFLRHDWVLKQLVHFRDESVGVTLGALLATGGIGILLSTIHHTFHWLPFWTIMDHRPILRRLVQEGVLKIEGCPPTNMTQEQSWVITSALWHERLSTNPLIGSAEPRSKDLVDLMHSIGTTCVAAVLASIVAFSIAIAISDPQPAGGWAAVRFILAVIVAGGAIYSFLSSYLRTARLTEGFVGQVLTDALFAEKKDNTSKGEKDQKEDMVTPIVTRPFLRTPSETVSKADPSTSSESTIPKGLRGLETSSDNLRSTVQDSFNIYQATVAMVAIFIGFVFTAALELLTSEQPFSVGRQAVVWLLAAAMLLLSLSLLCFHATAHRVVRYWRIFYPVSIYNKVGALAFSFGLLAMFESIAALLWIRSFHVASIVVGVAGLALIIFGFTFRSMHGASDYMVQVDPPRDSRRETTPPREAPAS